MLKRIDASMKTSLVITKPPVWFGSKFKQRESPPSPATYKPGMDTQYASLAPS